MDMKMGAKMSDPGDEILKAWYEVLLLLITMIILFIIVHYCL